MSLIIALTAYIDDKMHLKVENSQALYFQLYTGPFSWFIFLNINKDVNIFKISFLRYVPILPTLN